jgi:UPF0716 protein FxsA
MFRRGTLGSTLGVALLAELIVFLLVAHWIGLGAAILLSIATSLFGAARLRRSGDAAFKALRGLSGPLVLGEGRVVDGMLQALGGLFLLIPGFLSDFLGLVLIAPSGRRWIADHFGLGEAAQPRPRPGAARIVDLGADDWTRIDNVRHG